LKSNDAEQVRIEKEFKKLNYFYIRKRMSRAEAVKYGADKYSFKINKEQLARACAACVLGPYEVRLGKDRLFEDDVYSQVFDGRKASEYLLVYWLYRDVEYWSKGTNKYAYAKWHVLNLLWSLLGTELKKISYRDQFRIMTERRRFYVSELEPLDKIVKEAFRFSSAFYVAHKRIDGKNQEPIDFFKHKNMHKLMRKSYEQSGKYKTNITKHTSNLLQSIQATADKK
jgi:hypothetical protein